MNYNVFPNSVKLGIDNKKTKTQIRIRIKHKLKNLSLHPISTEKITQK